MHKAAYVACLCLTFPHQICKILGKKVLDTKYFFCFTTETILLPFFIFMLLNLLLPTIIHLIMQCIKYRLTQNGKSTSFQVILSLGSKFIIAVTEGDASTMLFLIPAWLLTLTPKTGK
jgi:hypothetical protein